MKNSCAQTTLSYFFDDVFKHIFYFLNIIKSLRHTLQRVGNGILISYKKYKISHYYYQWHRQKSTHTIHIKKSLPHKSVTQ